MMPSRPHYAKREQQIRAAFNALFVLMFLSLITPLWLWAELPEWGTPNLGAGLAVLLCVYCSARLAAIAYSGKPQLLAVTFFVFVYVWGGISAFAQNYAGIFPWMIRHTESEAHYGILQILLAVAAYDLGRWLARARGAVRHPLRIDVSPRLVFAVSLASVPLMLIGILMLGGVDALFTTRAALVASAQGAGSKMAKLMATSLMRAPAFVAFMLVCMLCYRDWRSMSRGRKRMFGGLFLLTGGACLIGNFPLSLPRNWLGTVVLSPLFMLLPWRRWQVGALCVGLVALLLFVFPYSDAFRRQSSFSFEAIQNALRTKVVENVLNKGDYDAYQQTINALVVVKERGFSYGENLAAAALFWVPRSLWPEKPFGTGQLVGFYLGYPRHQTNLSAPLWMEAYWAFGWLGIFAILSVHGYLSSILDRRFVSGRGAGSRDAAVMVAVPFFAAYQFMLLRGDLLNGIAQAAPVVILFLLVTRIRRLPPPLATLVQARPLSASNPARDIR